jgi:hypothetical protein
VIRDTKYFGSPRAKTDGSQVFMIGTPERVKDISMEEITSEI